jgi:hypothetical protein
VLVSDLTNVPNARPRSVSLGLSELVEHESSMVTREQIKYEGKESNVFCSSYNAFAERKWLNQKSH